MEAKFDKYDSILKIAIYGSSFCKYLVSLSADPRSEAVSERIEQITDLSYRVRSFLGALGIYLDSKSLSGTWKSLVSPKQSLNLNWKQLLETSIISSGILSNSMDLAAAIIWFIPKFLSFMSTASGTLRFCFGWLFRLKSSRGVKIRAGVASAKASEDSWLDVTQETVEWLANVFWAIMSALSLCSSMYTIYVALSKAKKKSLDPETRDEVREAGLEAIESALDLVAGGAGALQLDCEASGVLGLAPTLAGCLHLSQLDDNDESNEVDQDVEVDEKVIPEEPVQVVGDVPAVLAPIMLEKIQDPLDLEILEKRKDDASEVLPESAPLIRCESKLKPKDRRDREHKKTVIES